MDGIAILGEADSMIDYMMFEVNAENIISDLIIVLKTKSPFELLEKDGISQMACSLFTNRFKQIFNKVKSKSNLYYPSSEENHFDVRLAG